MSIADKASDLILTGPRYNKGNFLTKSCQYNSPGDEKTAKGLRWVFYKKYDCHPFVLAHNSPFWPDISLADKLSMVKCRKLYYCQNDVSRRSWQFCPRCLSEVCERKQKFVGYKFHSVSKHFSSCYYFPTISSFLEVI